MIQRIATRLILEHKDKILMIRRSDGRDSILGKYELPGGRVFANEQPEDSLRRYLKEDLGVGEKLKIQLKDALTYTDQDDRSIQYAIFLYKAEITDSNRAIHLGHHHDKYVWYDSSKLDSSQMTDLTKVILGIASPEIKPDQSEDAFELKLPTVYSDGGSRGNPGPSAAGYVLIDQSGKVVGQGGEYLGVTTNNQAEYHGVKLGLEAALAYGWREINFKVDSMLVVNQLNGIYKIKNRDLWPVHESVKELINQFEKVKFFHVRRELNQLADGIVNKTLDAAKRDKYNKGAAR